jgi:peptidyl-dipeptidase Dcp
MRKHIRLVTLIVLASALGACPSRRTDMPRKPPVSGNPLLAPWTGPHGGVPPFDRVKLEHFQPAVEQAMADSLAALARIAADPRPADFENTLAAMERASRPLHRALAVLGVWSGGLNTPGFQTIERAVRPKLAAYSDQVVQNAALFQRIEAVYEGREKAGLNPEQARLAWKIWNDFVRSGARLDAAAKARLTTINQALAGLFTRFGQNVLKDEEDQLLLLETEADLAGLPTSLREAAAAEATRRKLPGKWVIANTRSSVAPFLTTSTRRDLRERAFKMFVDRGDRGGDTDNNALITQILALRAERAKLLGYATHAHWRLESSMAKTPEAALQLLTGVWTPAVARVKQEVADMQALADRESPGQKIKIEAWDYRYYAEKVRKEKYALDEGELKPYLQLDKLREGMFWVAGELFGLDLRPLGGVPVFHPDVRAFEVVDRASARVVGLYYFDPFARQGKRSGAWMAAYRSQERLDGAVLPIVSNNSNFLPGKPGEPVTVSWDDARTLFHEFGHALHGLLSNVTYPTLAGTAVVRDFVELPSQLLEHWLSTPEVLGRFALHVQTGAPMPKALAAKIEKAATFNQGFDTVEFLASALMDMKLHLAGSQKIDPDAFERETLGALGLPSEIVMRHRTPQFLHVFASDSYSAGYYSYLWADVLVADAFEAFREAGGPYDKAVAARLREHVLSAGNKVDPAEAYRRFRGRDATVDALMRKRGFPVQ